jgi:glycosyltransferase involved in cell wall biosynthesis
MLVAGDNYGALLITLLLKLIISSNIRVQISIHGNPINHGGSKFKNLLRMISFKLLVPRASSVRLVSKHLLFELGDFFGRNAEIIVSPVPVVLPNRFVAKRIGNRVGLIGRLHYERGISLFRDIVTELISQDQNYEFLIVGDGPERPLLSELASRNPKVRIDFLGTISQIEVQEKLLDIKLLLSCAENEGYGLSIREAILSGTPVIAKENAGTRELRNSFPEMVFLFETIGEAVELIKSEIDSTVNIETVRRYREKQANIDAEGISSLINSWA